ncbi:MAG TPA: cytosine permease [Actinomycetota bacterium]|nr:cytosine permease [Actinomycetota bacterium]
MSTVLDRPARSPREGGPPDGAGGDWGIEPVPPERRTLSAFDLAILWADLGVGLLVLVTGALLVPGLGFGAAAAAIVLGSVIGVALLALAGAAGAEHGVTSMVLFRPVLGIRGSWIPSALNALQLVGWTAVELWAMSFVADLVSQRVFGWSSRPLWLAAATIVCTGLALWGPLGVTRVWMKRFAAWVVSAICVLVTIAVLADDRVREALTLPGTGGWPTFGLALDLVIAMPVSWLPLVADYTRFGKGPRAAFGGTFCGYLIANVWLYLLGALLVLGGGAEPSPEGIATGVLAVAGGSVAGVLFLAGLLAGETDEAFADVYSGALSLRNIFPRLPRSVATVAISAVACALAAWLTMERYESFLFLLGSVFVPLFGILVADHFVSRRRRLDVDDLYRERGRYWYSGGVRIAALVPWVAGLVVYHWIAPTGPGWWLAWTDSLLGTPLSARWPWISASVVSFAVAFLAALALRAPTIIGGATGRRGADEDRSDVRHM